MVTDPVCKMTLTRSRLRERANITEKTYYFCATSCKTKFDANPGAYVRD